MGLHGDGTWRRRPGGSFPKCQWDDSFRAGYEEASRA